MHERFGQYLIRKGRIRETDLAHALRVQDSLRPHPLVLGAELGVLTPAQALVLFDRAESCGDCVFDAIAADPQLGPQVGLRLREARSLGTPRIGEILLRHGHLDARALLDELEGHAAWLGLPPVRRAG